MSNVRRGVQRLLYDELSGSSTHVQIGNQRRGVPPGGIRLRNGKGGAGMRGSWVVITLCAAGCTSFPPLEAPPVESTPVELPDTWTAPATGELSQLPADWAEVLGDPRAGEIVDAVVLANPSLLAAEARLEQAVARARIAGADLWPQASLSADVAGRKQNFVGFPIPGVEEGGVFTATTTTYGASLNVSWEADVWGRLRARRLAGQLEAEASALDLESARRSLGGQAIKAWLLSIEAAEQERLAGAILRNRLATLDRIERRYREGLAAALDLRLARTSEALTRSIELGRRLQRDGAERQLETLMGRYPDRSFDTGLSLPAPPGPLPAGIPVEALRRRPDVLAAEMRMLASSQRVREARAALYPQIRLTGSAGVLTDDASRLTDGDFSIWSLALGLVQPIFQGGRLRANVDLSGAVLDEAEAAFFGTVLRAVREVESALIADAILAEQEAVVAVAVENATRARESAGQRYTSGLVDYLAVLESERQELDSKSQLIELRRRRLDTRVDLYLALGGPWLAPAVEPAGSTTPLRNGASE